VKEQEQWTINQPIDSRLVSQEIDLDNCNFCQCDTIVVIEHLYAPPGLGKGLAAWGPVGGASKTPERHYARGGGENRVLAPTKDVLVVFRRKKGTIALFAWKWRRKRKECQNHAL